MTVSSAYWEMCMSFRNISRSFMYIKNNFGIPGKSPFMKSMLSKIIFCFHGKEVHLGLFH